jgi:hypothetical protein
MGPGLPTSSGRSGTTAIEGATDTRLAVQELQKWPAAYVSAEAHRYRRADYTYG